MGTLFYALVTGALFGLFFAFLGIGLNLIFGVLRLVNLSHGDFVVLGGYAAYGAYTAWHLNPLIAIPALIVPAIVVGVALYYGAITRLRRSLDVETASLILFFGLSQVIQGVMSKVFTVNNRTVPVSLWGKPIDILGQHVPPYEVISAAVTIPALGLLYLYLYRTRLGLATRALMVDVVEARANGINVARVSALALGIGLAFAAMAGPTAISMLGSLNPGSGTDITVTAFAVVVLGSLGKPFATAVGGLVYGGALELTQNYQPSWASVVPYVLLLVILMIRPSGILGGRLRNA